MLSRKSFTAVEQAFIRAQIEGVGDSDNSLQASLFFKQEIIVKRKGSSKWKDEKLCLFLSFKVCFSQAF